ncbi:MAG: hypothetical protein ACE5JR_11855 [Gemmatimonadota bacterium]
MIRDCSTLSEFEKRYGREAFADLTYERALEIFAAMWKQARELNESFPGPWEDDIEADLAIARAVNGLPPL